MIQYEWIINYAIGRAICNSMFDTALSAFDNAKAHDKNSETIVIVAKKPAAFLEADPKYIYGLDIPELYSIRLKRIIAATIKIFAEENGINIEEQRLGSAIYNRNGDRVACEKGSEYLFPESMKKEEENGKMARILLVEKILKGKRK